MNNNQNQCIITISGFGPFGTVLNNPTMELVKSLTDDEKKNYNIAYANVLEVSIEGCQDHIQKVKDFTQNCDFLVNLHFGVFAGSPGIQLEQCSYNMQHFSIPDVRGNQPQKEKILENKFKNEPLQTKLDLKQILQRLQEKGIQKLKISNDPGRYICNYVYYCSLHEMSHCKNSTSLFVHFPQFDVVNQEDQKLFVIRLIETIQELYGNQKLIVA